MKVLHDTTDRSIHLEVASAQDGLAVAEARRLALEAEGYTAVEVHVEQEPSPRKGGWTVKLHAHKRDK